MDTNLPSTATERARLAVILTTIAISVVVVVFSAAPWSDWRTGLLLNLIEKALLVAFSVRYKDRLIPHLMLFGLAVGSPNSRRTPGSWTRPGRSTTPSAAGR